MIVPMRYWIVVISALVLLAACAEDEDRRLEGRPGGPYRLTLQLDPGAPRPGEETQFNFQLTHTQSGRPVRELQLAHERLMHHFIVNLDFSSFAHVHHEDFHPFTDSDRTETRVRFPYRFPKAGHYRIVSEFARQDRLWTKHFDIEVGAPGPVASVPVDSARARRFGDYTATLRVSPQTPVAGYETELVLEIQRDGAPVTDLELYLGSELHAAVWRDDGKYFGHLHSHTPRVAAIIELAHDRGIEPALRGARIAEMLVQLMCLDAELVFSGPTIPMRYVFPEPGRYHLFLQAAPKGEPELFQFVVDAVPFVEGIDTTMHPLSDL